MNKIIAAFHVNKLRFALVTILLVTPAFAGWTRSPLGMEERVAAQEAMDRVFYEKRIWPEVNPNPKPRFEEMVPREFIEAKVETYLKESTALAEYWAAPITSEQIQAEMDRMVTRTKDPDGLRKLFTALHDDPELIAECLARPLLADRLAREFYAYDPRIQIGRASCRERV